MTSAPATTTWRALRVVTGLQFVATGSFSVFNWRDTVMFNEALFGHQASATATAVGTALTIFGGLSLVTGYRTSVGAASILAFLLPATIRHLLVVADIDTTLALSALAKRGQLASASKNLVLIALALAFARTQPNTKIEGRARPPRPKQRDEQFRRRDQRAKLMLPWFTSGLVPRCAVILGAQPREWS